MIHVVPPRFTAFMGHQRLASGPLADVALAVLKASGGSAAEPIVIFDDTNGRPIDLNLRGTEREVVERLPRPAPDVETLAEDLVAPEPRGRGRPKLGAIAPERSLLPRPWECVGVKPGEARGR